MKLFISADIEGVSGIVAWDETDSSTKYHDYFAEQMTREVNAACEGANEVGANEILLKDAHDSARNINPSNLPVNVKIFRGWSKTPLSMMAGLDETFDAALMVGYHCAAGTNGNPLAHTMNLQNEYIKINGDLCSEFMINSYIASYFKVPVVFVSGDKLLCESAKVFNSDIKTMAVSEGLGNGSISIHPQLAQEQIKQAVKEALKGDLSKCLVELPSSFIVEIHFREHFKAYRASFYPGAKQIDAKTVMFSADDYFEVLKFFMFVL